MNHCELDPWFLKNLVDPKDKTSLDYLGQDQKLISKSGNFYPVIEGVPIMLIDEVEQTIDLARQTLQVANKKEEPYFISTLGITESEKAELRNYISSQSQLEQFVIDPIVQFLVAATNGILYKDSIQKLDRYPIPEIRLPNALNQEKLLLDIGCSWGRWCVAAAQKGYQVIGLDPSLGAVLAGKRIAKKMNLNIKFVVGDARYLPFRENLFDDVFSYSVLQHFSKEDVFYTLTEINRILKIKGNSLIQMPNMWGIRSLQHQISRGFKNPQNFDVRYWSINELNSVFNEKIGNSKILIDGFFGLGIQSSDLDLMPTKYKLVIKASETLRKLDERINLFKNFADSLYIKSEKSFDK